MGAHHVLLAVPSVNGERLAAIADLLKQLGVDVQVLPSYVDMMSGRVEEALRTVNPDELLGRTRVDLEVQKSQRPTLGA